MYSLLLILQTSISIACGLTSHVELEFLTHTAEQASLSLYRILFVYIFQFCFSVLTFFSLYYISAPKSIPTVLPTVQIFRVAAEDLNGFCKHKRYIIFREQMWRPVARIKCRKSLMVQSYWSRSGNPSMELVQIIVIMDGHKTSAMFSSFSTMSWQCVYENVMLLKYSKGERNSFAE